jgi:membrane peptidoglycan carboxypeptidase
VLVVVAVLGAGLLLPYVGGVGLVAKSESDKFLNSTCDLQETAPPQGTTIYASDGTTVLATIFKQDRKPVDISQMPTFLQQALVDTEDRRFYQHHGVDMRGLIRSAFSTGSGDTQGGSTLTMQYVKQERYYQAGDNLALQQAAISQTLDRKIQDAKCAIDLEKRESKKQILENYLNIAFFGENSYSVESAAETYFNVSTAKLTLPEAALLVGVLRAPSDYDPFQHPDAAKERRNEVIQNMVTANDLSQAQATAYEATPVKLFTAAPPTVTQGCYNASTAIQNVGFFCSYVENWLENTQGLSADQISQGGYKVVTTLNAALQNSAQTSLSAVFPASSPTTAVLPVVDPKTGNVLAMASSKPYGINSAAGQISNQIFTDYNANAASTYKYFTMITALKAGITGSFTLTNNSTDKKSYNPKSCNPAPVTNGDPNVTYNPTESLATAIAKSSNTYFVGIEDQLFNGCDLSPIVNTATGLGLNGLNQVDPGPNGTGKTTYAKEIETSRQWSLTLGEYPTSPLELTGAYAAAANDGTYCTPAPILSITDESGRPVSLKRTPCSVQMTPQVARTAVSLLNGVTKSGGDASKVFSSYYSKGGSAVAGKTGTDGALDANGADTLNSSFWFVGMTPNLTATMALINVGHPGDRHTWLHRRAGRLAARRLDRRPVLAGVAATDPERAEDDVPGGHRRLGEQDGAGRDRPVAGRRLDRAHQRGLLGGRLPDHLWQRQAARQRRLLQPADGRTGKHGHHLHEQLPGSARQRPHPERDETEDDTGHARGLRRPDAPGAEPDALAGELRPDQVADPLAVGAAGDPGLHELHHGAHLAGLARPGLGDRRADQLDELDVGELRGQVAVQDDLLGPFPVGQLGPSRSVEGLGRLAPLLGLAGEHLQNLVVAQFPGLLARDLLGGDRRQRHPQGRGHQLVPGLHRGVEVGVQAGFQLRHGFEATA